MRERRAVPVWDYGLYAGVRVASKRGGGKSSRAKEGKGTPEARVQAVVDRLPLSHAVTGGKVTLPKVSPPSLKGLEVTVPAPGDITQDELIARFQELVRAAGTRRDKSAGEALAMGDDVQLDVLGYCNGKLIPFSPRADLWMELAPLAHLPGFTEALAGEGVGDAVTIELTLPGDYPVESLRGAPASFVVDIKAAKEVRLPDAESPAFLRTLGKGADLDAVMAKISEELEDELADLLWVEAQDRVLDELASRVEVKLPKELIDEEIRRRWAAAEQPILSDKGFDAAEQDEALAGWLGDAATRRDVEKRLTVALGLKAIAEAEKLSPTPEKVGELLAEVAEQVGITPAEVKRALKADKASAGQIEPVVWHLFMVGEVMNRAKIHFEGAAG